MAASNQPVARAVRSVWPADVPLSPKDIAAEMAYESVDALLNHPEALSEAIMDQWVIDGGERSQRATDAVLTAVYGLRDRKLG
eukprot:4864377-Alexandrium_andersonii.AAC.1